MSRRDEGSPPRRFRAFLILALLVKADQGNASDAADGAAPMTVARASKLPGSVVKAVQDAAALLARPGCGEIFDDFRDAGGRTLRQNLDALGVSGAAYLGWTVFYDGLGKPICQRPDILAATAPGSRAIFVCVAQFTLFARHDPGLAAALIIHEELHSLGLGENPPDSKAITAQVVARCGK